MPNDDGPGSATDSPPVKKPVWPWVLLVVGVVALFCVVVIGVPLVRESARRQNCHNNISVLGCAVCHLYADDNEEEFPQNLQQLYPKYADNAKLFSCPSHRSSYEDFAAGKVTERSSSYVLLPGRSAGMPADFFLVYENPENHGWHGFHVIYLNGRAEWWPAAREAEFRRKLAEQSAAVAEWRKTHPKSSR